MAIRGFVYFSVFGSVSLVGESGFSVFHGLWSQVCLVEYLANRLLFFLVFLISWNAVFCISVSRPI